MFISKTSEI